MEELSVDGVQSSPGHTWRVRLTAMDVHLRRLLPVVDPDARIHLPPESQRQPGGPDSVHVSLFG